MRRFLNTSIDSYANPPDAVKVRTKWVVNVGTFTSLGIVLAYVLEFFSLWKSGISSTP
ncbi:MAG: hypothetical protein PHU33_18035 [Bacteroidales bacterium]|nr:hypothetical protein [Bacteroidales bacterium]